MNTINASWADKWGCKEILTLQQLLLKQYDFKEKKAYDLGCGIGLDSLSLLNHGWRVTAVDSSAALIAHLKPCIAHQQNFEFKNIPFSQLQIEACNLVNAKFSLPFCPSKTEFNHLWKQLYTNLNNEGFFIGQLFGLDDDWNGIHPLVFHSTKEVTELMEGYRIIQQLEIKRNAQTASTGLKNWHIYHLVLQKIVE